MAIEEIIEDIEDFDEYEMDCECDLDYDEDEDFDDEEEEKPKKKPKAPAKTVDSLLAVLRNQFDEVIFETREDEWFSEITYQHLECRNFVSSENKNPHIVYEVWLEVDIANSTYSSRHKEYLEYIADNMKMLRSEDRAFFDPKELVNKGGIMTMDDKGMPNGSNHKKHIGMKKPTADDFVEKMKSILTYVFKDSPLDKKNDRFGRFDDYWFDTYAWNWADFEEYKQGIEPIILFQLFAHPIRAYLGPRFVKYSEMRKEGYVNYWIWADMERTWNDRNGNSHELDLINDTDIIEWLYDFTGWPRKEHDLYGDTMELVVNHLRNRDRDEDIKDWNYHVETLARKARNPKEFKALLTEGIKYDANGGFGGGGFLHLLGSGGNYCLDHKIEYKVSINPRYVKYLGIDDTQYSVDKYGHNLNVFDAQKQDIWEYVFTHFNPKPKVLDLFSMFDDEPQQETETIATVVETATVVEAVLVNDETSILADDIEEQDDCGCELDYEDEGMGEDFIDEDEEPKVKGKKSAPKTVDSLLSVLNNWFDEVTYKKCSFYKQIPEVVEGISSQMNETYYHLTCSMLASDENKNPNIEYVTWLELKIRDHHDFVLHTLQDVVRQYEVLVKNEDLRFFDKENMYEIDKNKRIGLNHYLLYKDRKNDPMPSFEEVVETRKKHLAHLFQNGILEDDNPRFDVKDDVNYYFGGYDFLERANNAYKNGIDDIGLVKLFGITIYAGIIKTSLRHDSSEYTRRTYEVNGAGEVHDSGNNTTYHYMNQNIEEYVQWLRQFSQIPERKFENLEKEIELSVLQYLRYSHKFESEADLLKALKQTSNVEEFIKSCGVFHGHRWAIADYFILDFTDRGQNRVAIKLRESVATHYGISINNYEEFNGHRGIKESIYTILECDPYKFIFERFNPKPKMLSLFDDLGTEKVEPANNMIEAPKTGVYQISLF